MCSSISSPRLVRGSLGLTLVPPAHGAPRPNEPRPPGPPTPSALGGCWERPGPGHDVSPPARGQGAPTDLGASRVRRGSGAWVSAPAGQTTSFQNPLPLSLAGTLTALGKGEPGQGAGPWGRVALLPLGCAPPWRLCTPPPHGSPVPGSQAPQARRPHPRGAARATDSQPGRPFLPSHGFYDSKN